jgi:membrane dipeptidase
MNALRPVTLFLLWLLVSLQAAAECPPQQSANLPRYVFDAHVDPAGRLLSWNVSLADSIPGNQVDLPKLREGGVTIIWMAIWVDPRRYQGQQAFERANALIDYVEQDIKAHAKDLALCRTSEECIAANTRGKIAVLLGLEGGEPLMNSPEIVDHFWRRGIRRITLTWRGDLEWAGSSQNLNQTPIKKPKGLTELGVEMVRRMNERGIVVDLSHVSSLTARQALEISTRPCIFSHSNAYRLCPHPRNVSDDLLKKLRDNGGVIGVNFHSGFLLKNYIAPFGKFNAATIEDVVRQIDYMRDVVGIDHVGIGSDWDGDIKPARGLEDASKLPQLWQALRFHGYSDQEIAKIAGLNFLRVLRENELAK